MSGERVGAAVGAARRVGGRRGRVVGVVWLVVVLGWGFVVGAQEPPSPGFGDVSGSSVHASGIEALGGVGLLEGTLCGEGLFCPGDGLPRWVMAVWLVRALDGADPDATGGGSRFGDVDASAWWAGHVERLAVLGVTLGCSAEPLLFCPAGVVTRAEMASFLVRAFGLADAPSAGFADTAGSVHASNIDALAAARVTAGCSVEPLSYCPRRSVTRAEMATFLARALHLILQPELPASAPENTFSEVAVGNNLVCGLKVDNSIVCWGDYSFRACAPSGSQFICSSEIIDEDGYGPLESPDGQFTAISAGPYRFCAIRVDQTIQCWLGTDQLKSKLPLIDTPEGQFTDISVARRHTCAIRADQSVECWGGEDPTDPCFDSWNTLMNCDAASLHEWDVPSGSFVSVSSGGDMVCSVGSTFECFFWFFSCGIKTDGTVTCWGFDDRHSVLDSPDGTFTAIASGKVSTCGIRVDGTLDCWGGLYSVDYREMSGPPPADPPEGTFLSISASSWDPASIGNFCGIRTDGTATCWTALQIARGKWTLATVVMDTPPGEFTSVATFGTLDEGPPARLQPVEVCGVRTDGTINCWGRRYTSRRTGEFDWGLFDGVPEGMPEGVNWVTPDGDPVEPDKSQIAGRAEIIAAETEMARLVNELRQSLGLAPLLYSNELAEVARHWSQAMRDQDNLYHNPTYSQQYPPGWRAAGENVAVVYGTTVLDSVQRAFEDLVASPEHYANMTRPEFNYLGIGISIDGSSVWFTQNLAYYP